MVYTVRRLKDGNEKARRVYALPETQREVIGMRRIIQKRRFYNHQETWRARIETNGRSEDIEVPVLRVLSNEQKTRFLLEQLIKEDRIGIDEEMRLNDIQDSSLIYDPEVLEHKWPEEKEK